MWLAFSSEKNYAKNYREEGAFFNLVKSEIIRSNQVESAIYSKKVLNRFPSVRFPFAGTLFGLPVNNLQLIGALRSCAGAYEKLNSLAESGEGPPLNLTARSDWDKVQKISGKLVDQTNVLDIVVPVYNNGVFFIAKCLPSLVANTSWGNMRVIVVDDGSDDPITQEILNRAEKCIENVVVVRLSGPASGTASVPRNVGIEQATSDLVAFLDPDNEISVRGYDELIRQFNDSPVPVQMVSGYQVKVGDSLSFNSRNALIVRRLIRNPRELFRYGRRFPIISTQAAVISRSFLQDTGIRFIEGAVGQDTLFGWELLLHASCILFCPKPFIVYYCQRTGSVLNNGGLNYFKRALIREKAQSEVFRQAGILTNYRDSQLKHAMNELYNPKLMALKGEDRVLAQRYVEEINHLYAP